MQAGGAQSWRNEILEPVWRFPLPLVFAGLATLLNWRHPEYRLEAGAGQLTLTLYCAAAFFWSWAAALWAEVQSDRVTGMLAGLGGAVLLALIFRIDLAVPLWLWGAPGDPESGLTVSHAMLLAALALAPSFAPYLTRNASQSAFWQYNHKWVIAYLSGGLGAVLAFAGVAAIIASLALLLEVPVPGWIYGNVWLVCSFLVLPWIWLALAPEDFAEETKTGAHQEFTSRAIGLLVVYILIPVTTVLSAVLAAYVVKVVAEGSFATARLGLTSVIYGASVILVMLMAYPQRLEHPLVRLFWRVWPFLLIAPTLLIIPTLWTRISTYGWTPSRYLAVILAIWIAGVMLVGLIMRSEEDLRVITGLLAALLLVTAFGPWGIADVSVRSQFGRLEALLTAKGLLADGHWREPAGPIPWDRQADSPPAEKDGAILVGDDDRAVAAGALDVLAQTHQLDRLQPWFEGQPDSPFETRKAGQTANDAVSQKLALRAPMPRGLVSGSIVFTVSSPAAIALSGEPGTLIGPVSLNSTQPLQNYDTDGGPLSMTLDGKQVQVQVGQSHIASFDLTKTLAELEARSTPQPLQRKAIILEGADGSKARLAITYLSGATGQSFANLLLTGYLLLPGKP